MGTFSRSAACLRIFGDDLSPDAITTALGCAPIAGELRGERIRLPSGRERTAKCGQWRLDAERVAPENLGGQIRGLLAQLSDDLEVWKELSKSYEIDLFSGLFMDSGNDGMVLPPDVMLMLGQRAISLSLDVYAPLDYES